MFTSSLFFFSSQPLSNAHVNKLCICILRVCDVTLFLNCNRVHIYTVLGYAPGARWRGWIYAIRRVTNLISYLLLGGEFVKRRRIMLDVLVRPCEGYNLSTRRVSIIWSFGVSDFIVLPADCNVRLGFCHLLLRVTRIVPWWLASLRTECSFTGVGKMNILSWHS